MQTDDEDEDDGHYDVISGNKRARALSAQARLRTAVKDTPTSSHCDYKVAAMKEDCAMPNYQGVKVHSAVLHLDAKPDYDGGDGSDSTYAGIRDSSPSASSVDVGQISAEQEHLPVVADVTYAQIEDKQGRSRSSAQWSRPVEDSAEVYSAPPVPHKNYEPGEDSQAGSMSTSLGPDSPSLPPRNSLHSTDSEGASVAVAAMHLYETPSEPGHSAAGDGGLYGAGPVTLPTSMGMMAPGAIVCNDAGAAAASALPCFSDSASQSKCDISITVLHT